MFNPNYIAWSLNRVYSTTHDSNMVFAFGILPCGYIRGVGNRGVGNRGVGNRGV